MENVKIEEKANKSRVKISPHNKLSTCIDMWLNALLCNAQNATTSSSKYSPLTMYAAPPQIVARYFLCATLYCYSKNHL